MVTPLLPIKSQTDAEFSKGTHPGAQILYGAISEAICGSWSADCLEKIEYEQRIPFVDLKQKIMQTTSTATPHRSHRDDHQSYGKGPHIEKKLIKTNEVDEKVTALTEYVLKNALLGLLQDSSNIVEEV